jgi:hypothetical protein
VRALAPLLWSSLALAQAPTNASLSYEALQKAQKGAWAEYAMTVGTQKGTTMRYSLVEKSAKALALEIETTVPALVMRMDFASAGEGWNLQRIRMRLGTGPVQEVPPPENAGQLIKKGGNFGTLLGSETLKTPAGSYECKHYKQTTEQGEAEVWMSDKALPSGLVQTLVSGLGAKITLVAVGGGATTKIK